MTTSTLPTAEWADKKRSLWMLGFLMPTLPFVGGLIAQTTGWGLFWWFGPLFVYGAIPLLDWLIGEDSSNPPEAMVPTLEKDRYYRWIVYLAVPGQLLIFFWGMWTVVNADISLFAKFGVAISVAMVGGIGINTAHELGHKTDVFERWLAKVSLAPVLYGHFYAEHNRGHHIRVATPEDPASSRFGETFYSFLPRSVLGSLVSAWEIEKKRLQREGKSVWHWSNDNLNAWAMSLVLFGGMIAWLGWAALPWMLLQAVYGFSLLEVVNYLEHYGLCRQKTESGRYERCQPEHSWNSNHIVTNLFLYQLQRHSDHHANPTRSFQSLRDFDNVPRLPSGYASMILLAYVPPLWFKVMDPKVVAHHKGDMSKANILPAIREQVLARYPLPQAG